MRAEEKATMLSTKYGLPGGKDEGDHDSGNNHEESEDEEQRADRIGEDYTVSTAGVFFERAKSPLCGGPHFLDKKRPLP